jgi:hypothetical protein
MKMNVEQLGKESGLYISVTYHVCIIEENFLEIDGLMQIAVMEVSIF